MGARIQGRRAPLRAMALVVVVAVAALGATSCQPRESRKDRAILFIHGWNALGGGSDCSSTFGSLSSFVVQKRCVTKTTGAAPG